MIIVVGSVLQEDNKYYQQVCLHECVYEFVNKLQRACNFCTIYMLVINTHSAFIFNGTKTG